MRRDGRKNNGGSRPGAGRPKGAALERHTITLEKWQVEYLCDMYGDIHGLSARVRAAIKEALALRREVEVEGSDEWPSLDLPPREQKGVRVGWDMNEPEPSS